MRTFGVTLLAKAEKIETSNWASDRFIIAALILTWIAAISLINPSGDFPLNDDWVYGLVVRNLLKTGHFQFISPASANLFTQAYWGALFCLPSGFSFAALRLSTLVIAALGVVSLYGVTREVGCSKTMATLASLLLIFNPLYLGLANTFMTDVPFTATLIICFYFYVIALKRKSKLNLALALLLALAALGIRQYGLIFIAALSAGYIVKTRLRWQAIVQALGATGLGVGLQWTYQRWLETSGQIQTSTDLVAQTYKQGIQMPLQSVRLQLLFMMLIYLGAFTLPSLLIYQKKFFAAHKKLGKLHLETIVTVAAACTAAAMVPNRLPKLGNILTYIGLGPLTLKDTFLLGLNYPMQSGFNVLIWTFFTICGSLGLVFLLLLFIHSITTLLKKLKQSPAQAKKSDKPALPRPVDSPPALPSSEAWLLTALLISILGYISILSFGHLFDRYLLPLYPLTLILISLFVPSNSDFDLIGRSGKALTVILIGLFAYFSVASAHDYLAWNRARWDALNHLTSVQKISPKLIDGGYEFNGWLLADKNYQPRPNKSYWWVDDDEYLIASGPLPGYQEIARYPFKRWLLIEEKPILTLKRTKKD